MGFNPYFTLIGCAQKSMIVITLVGGGIKACELASDKVRNEALLNHKKV